MAPIPKFPSLPQKSFFECFSHIGSQILHFLCKLNDEKYFLKKLVSTSYKDDLYITKISLSIIVI